MSIEFQILGRPFEDNALLVTVNPGESRHYILFDCGETCLLPVKPSIIMDIDHLCFSHFHLDHIAGFDRFLRMNYNRLSEPVMVWGPVNTIDVMHHRLQGVTWDLVEDASGEWILFAMNEGSVQSVQLFTAEEFKRIHPLEDYAYDFTVFDHEFYVIQACILSHRTPSVAYRITEPRRLNINVEALESAGMKSGPWLEKVKDLSLANSHIVEIESQEYSLGDLRSRLLVENDGVSIAYVTDCRYEDQSIRRLIEMVQGCDILVCESTYAVEDEDLAVQNYHLTTHQAARIAGEAGVGKLVLHHFSDRYQSDGAEFLLEQAREIFPETVLPENWLSF